MASSPIPKELTLTPQRIARRGGISITLNRKERDLMKAPNCVGHLS
jgi:hypothetical protein